MSRLAGILFGSPQDLSDIADYVRDLCVHGARQTLRLRQSHLCGPVFKRLFLKQVQNSHVVFANGVAGDDDNVSKARPFILPAMTLPRTCRSRLEADRKISTKLNPSLVYTSLMGMKLSAVSGLLKQTSALLLN